MPVIPVFSRGDSTDESGNKPHPAAAVMARFLADSSQPSQDPKSPKSSRAEETRPGKPESIDPESACVSVSKHQTVCE